MSEYRLREWTRIRVGNANASDETPNRIYEGFYAGDNMAGVSVWVTGETLRRFIEDGEAEQSEWDRLNNPFEERELLSFGGSTADASVQRAPDGITPVYLLGGYAFAVYQRFDPLAGKSYNVVRGGDVAEVRRYGGWVNVAEVDGIPVPVGFIVNPEHDTVFDTREPEPEPETSAQRTARAYAAITSEHESGNHAAYASEGGIAGCTTCEKEYATPQGKYFDHNGERTDDPRCVLGLCVACLDAETDRFTEHYRPVLSIGSRMFMANPDHRARVIAAFKDAGITLREDEDEASGSLS